MSLNSRLRIVTHSWDVMYNMGLSQVRFIKNLDPGEHMHSSTVCVDREPELEIVG